MLERAYALLAALATQTPPPPVQLNPAVPPALSALIERLMSKTPAGRPQSARAVLEELARSAAHGKVGGPRSGTKAAPAPNPSQPPPAADTLAVAAGPISTLPDVPDPEPLQLEPSSSVTIDVSKLFRPEPEPPKPAPPPPRGRRGLLIALGAAVAVVALVVVLLAKLKS